VVGLKLFGEDGYFRANGWLALVTDKFKRSPNAAIPCLFCQAPIAPGSAKCNACAAWLKTPEQAISDAENRLVRMERQALGGGALATLLLLALVYRGVSNPSVTLDPVPNVSLASAQHRVLKTEARLTADAQSFPHHYLMLSRANAWNAEFGTVLMLSAVVKNTAPIAIRDPQITCILIAESGKVLGSVSEKITQVIPHGRSVRLKNANMGFADNRWRRLSCSVTAATAVTGTG
jgi:hypothetical protein